MFKKIFRNSDVIFILNEWNVQMKYLTTPMGKHEERFSPSWYFVNYVVAWLASSRSVTVVLIKYRNSSQHGGMKHLWNNRWWLVVVLCWWRWLNIMIRLQSPSIVGQQSKTQVSFPGKYKNNRARIIKIYIIY